MTETTKQKEAISSWNQGPVCVTAGPGSGKTSVLTERFRWLVDKKKVSPQKILVITFTEKATQNLTERLTETNEFLGGRQRTFLRKPIDRNTLTLSTIHGFCASLLREHAFEAELDPDFSVMDQLETKIEQKRVIREVLEQAHIADPSAVKRFLRSFAGSNIEDDLANMHQEVCASGKKAFVQLSDPKSALRDLIEDLENAAEQGEWPNLAEEAKRLRTAISTQHLDYTRCLDNLDETLNQSIYSARRKKSEILKPLRNKRKDLPYVIAGAVNQDSREWLVAILQKLEQNFQEWKRSSSKCDFSDLQRHAVRLLKKYPHLAKRFDYILVDEYQDINPVQSRLIELLGKDRKTSASTPYVVGDINQSIYGFRYADPNLFQDFRTMVVGSGHPVDLPDNFRSRVDILLATETFLRGAEGIEPRSLTTGRRFPSKPIPSVEVLAAYAKNKEAARSREARHLATRILELKGKLELGVKDGDSGETFRKPDWKDFAVLARKHTNLEPIARAFRDARIPITAAGKRFFDAPEVRDLINLLHILVNPRDEIRFASVLRSPLVGISDETLLILKTEDVNLAQAFTYATSDAKPDTIFLPSEIDSTDLNRLIQFRQWLTYFRLARDETPIDLLLSRIMTKTGYEAYLLSQPDGLHQVANVRKFLDITRRQAKIRPAGFNALVFHIEEMQTSQPGESNAPVFEQSVDAVQLMTIHAAKGLEFPVVIVPSLESRASSNSSAAGFSPKHGVGAKWKNPTTASSDSRDDALHAIHEDANQRGREESNRLFYVAMTRAEEHLILSCSLGRSGFQRSAHGWLQLLKKAFKNTPQEKGDIFSRDPDNEPKTETLGKLAVRLLRTDRDPAIEPSSDISVETSPAKWKWAKAMENPLDHSDSTATVTGVSLFAACPRRYYLSRYLGFTENRQPATNKNYATESNELNPEDLGLKVHEVLANIAQPDPSEKEVVELVRRFRESDLGQRVPPNAKREQDLIFDVNGRLLRGKIDLWFDDDSENKRVLVDYKTDRVNKMQIAQRAQQYELQLRLYAHAIKQATGRAPDRAELYFLRADKAIEININPEARQNAAKVVHEFFEAQSNLSFPLREGEQCYQCPHYQGLCPSKLHVAGAPASK